MKYACLQNSSKTDSDSALVTIKSELVESSINRKTSLRQLLKVYILYSINRFEWIFSVSEP